MTPTHQTTLTVPVSNRDHVQGPANAPVTLLEYGDFECPYCAQAYPVVKKVQRQLGDQLCFVFRHFPMSTMHPCAERADEAAEAAAAQGRFWEMYDKLYENQDRLDYASLLRFAQILDLDVPRFTAEVARGVHHAHVQEEFVGGLRSRVNGTPCFFINGVRYDDSLGHASLLEAIIQAAS